MLLLLLPRLPSFEGFHFSLNEKDARVRLSAVHGNDGWIVEHTFLHGMILNNALLLFTLNAQSEANYYSKAFLMLLILHELCTWVFLVALRALAHRSEMRIIVDINGTVKTRSVHCLVSIKMIRVFFSIERAQTYSWFGRQWQWLTWMLLELSAFSRTRIVA